MTHPSAAIKALSQSLITQATLARAQAYAPYSNFQVGAALLAQDGSIYVGVNVENCAFGSTICAERHAIGTAVAAGARIFEAIAVVVDYDRLITPCGACRQVLSEFGVPWVLLHNLRTKHSAWVALARLLPDGPELKSLAEPTQN